MLVDPSKLNELLEDATPEQIIAILGAQEQLLGLAEANTLLQTGFQNTLATAAAELDNNRDNLFARANQNYRQEARGFAARGVGDSGFAARERQEFGQQRERDERSLLIDYQDTLNRATMSLNQGQLQSAAAQNEILNSLRLQDPVGLMNALIARGFSEEEARAMVYEPTSINPDPEGLLG